jgi:hypothetical protein
MLEKSLATIARLFHAGTRIIRAGEIERKDPSNFRSNPPGPGQQQAFLAPLYFGCQCLSGLLAAVASPA